MDLRRTPLGKILLQSHWLSRAVSAAVCLLILSLSIAIPVERALAQSATDIPTSVRIQGDTRITKLGDMDFGDILPGDTGGTITVAVDGSVSTTGSVIPVASTRQPASFEIERQILADYPTYVGPDGSDTIELVHATDPGARMTLRNFTTDFNRTIFFGLPAYFFRNTYDFRIGGTLDVAPDQLAGSYRGSFTVIIDYN